MVDIQAFTIKFFQLLHMFEIFHNKILREINHCDYFNELKQFLKYKLQVASFYLP